MFVDRLRQVYKFWSVNGVIQLYTANGPLPDIWLIEKLIWVLEPVGPSNFTLYLSNFPDRAGKYLDKIQEFQNGYLPYQAPKLPRYTRKNETGPLTLPIVKVEPVKTSVEPDLIPPLIGIEVHPKKLKRDWQFHHLRIRAAYKPESSLNSVSLLLKPEWKSPLPIPVGEYIILELQEKHITDNSEPR
jgi:hypothetical protein